MSPDFDNLSDGERVRLEAQMDSMDAELSLIERRHSRLEQTTDTVALVVLGHFEIDQALESLLQQYFVKPTEFSESGLDRFAVKAAILRALGVTDNSMHQLLLALNKLRNRVAHPTYEKLSSGHVETIDTVDVVNAAKGVSFDEFKFGETIRTLRFPATLRYFYRFLPAMLFVSAPAEVITSTLATTIRAEVRAGLLKRMNDLEWLSEYRDE